MARRKAGEEEKKDSEHDEPAASGSTESTLPVAPDEGAEAIPLPLQMPGLTPKAAVGIQFMMQRSSLDRLDPEIQQKLVELADVMDQRGYDFATRELADRGTARKQALYSISFFALLLILGGGIMAGFLVTNGESDKAFTLVMTGVAVIGALLGGAGLQSVFKKLSG